jgi:hypothetical protein
VSGANERCLVKAYEVLAEMSRLSQVLLEQGRPDNVARVNDARDLVMELVLRLEATR